MNSVLNLISVLGLLFFMQDQLFFNSQATMEMEMKTFSTQPTPSHDKPVRNVDEHDDLNKWEEYDSSSCSHYRVSCSPTLSTILEVPEPEELSELEKVPRWKEVAEPGVVPEPEELTPTYVVVEPRENGNAPLVGEDIEPNRCCGAIRRRLSKRTYNAILAGGFLLLLGAITVMIYVMSKYI